MKVWETDVIGVLELPNPEELQYRDTIFVNNQNSLQFAVRIISRQPESFPNVKIITCFTSDLEQWGFEDDYMQPDYVRKERLKEWLDDRLLIFQVEKRVRYNHEEVFNAKDVRVLPKLPSFDQDLQLIPVPIFSTQAHEIDEEEFLYRLTHKKFVGKIDRISHEVDDTPSLIMWREERELEETFKIFGEFERHQYAYGGFNFDIRDELKGGVCKEEWLHECYFCHDTDEIIYIPLTIYEEMVLGLKPLSGGVSVKSITEPINSATEITSEPVNLFTGEEVAATVDVTIATIDKAVNEEELEFLEWFSTYTQEAGLLYSKEDLINFHTCMKSSSLVILSGMSGTGKSKLVDLYSYSLGLKGDQTTLIPVSPSWTSDADLIGYADTMHMVYRPGDSGLINALKKAEDQPDKLFLICFDEMNLARVEHYFSQFLSILEMDAGKRTLRLYNDDLENRLYNSAQYPPTISIQDNVLFVGTINVDESTHHFSDKVLDRANVLELEVLPFSALKALPEKKKHIAGRKEEVDFDVYKSFRTEHRIISLTDEETSFLWDVHNALQKINRQLGVGPRIVKQIDRYLDNLPVQDVVTREAGFDLQFVQRILPKIRGSEEQLRALLGTYRDGEVKGGHLLKILSMYESVSAFTKSKKLIEQKAKELKFNGYTF